MRLTRLEDIKTLKPFDCGDDDLNGFKMLVNEIAEEAYTVPMYYDLKQLKQ